MVFFTEIGKTILKCVWNHERPHIAKEILRKKNKTRGIIPPDFKLSYKAIIIETVWYWHKNRHINQWNSTESPELNSHICSQLIFNKGAKNTQCEKDGLFNKQCWENRINTCRIMKLDPYLTPFTKNSKWFKDLNLRPDTIKLLEEKIAKRLLDFGLGNFFFLSMTSKAQTTKAKSTNGTMKLKSFCIAKETTK